MRYRTPFFDVLDGAVCRIKSEMWYESVSQLSMNYEWLLIPKVLGKPNSCFIKNRTAFLVDCCLGKCQRPRPERHGEARPYQQAYEPLPIVVG